MTRDERESLKAPRVECRWCGCTLAGVERVHRGDDGIDVYDRLCVERDGDTCDRRRKEGEP